MYFCKKQRYITSAIPCSIIIVIRIIVFCSKLVIESVPYPFNNQTKIVKITSLSFQFHLFMFGAVHFLDVLNVLILTQSVLCVQSI